MQIRRFALFAAVTLLAALLVVPSVSAQPPGGGRGGFGFGRGGGGLMGLLRNEAVQKELEMLDDQIAAVEKLGEKLQEEFPRPEIGNFRDMSEQDREKAMAQFRERSEKVEKAAAKQLAEILLPPQMKRLKEILVQQMGLRALTNAEVAAALKLNDAQKQKIETALEESSTAMREAPRPEIDFRNASQEERDKAIAQMREQREKLQKQAEEKTLAILTATQKKQFEEMKGEAFEMPQPQFGGRGTRGARGGDAAGGGRGTRGTRGGRPQN